MSNMNRTFDEELFFFLFCGAVEEARDALLHGADPNATTRRVWARIYAQENHRAEKWDAEGITGNVRRERERQLFAKLWTEDVNDSIPEGRSWEPTTRAVLSLAAGHRTQADALTALLLEAGADPNYTDEEGHTALLQAVARGDASTVTRLLAAGASVETLWKGRQTPLMSAAGRGDAEICDLLLKAGADPNAMGKSGATPLILAAAGGDLAMPKSESERWHQWFPARWSDVAALLLQAGADPHQTFGPRRRTALYFALKTGNGKRGILAAGASLSEPGILAAAATNGDLAMVRRLIAVGVDLEEPDTAGNPPLANAAGAGHLALVEELLEAGAKIDGGRKGDGIDGLARAVCNSQPECVARLLERGANPNRIYRDCEFPLYMAAKRGFSEVVEVLLSHGADRTLADSYGKTALDYASMTSWEEFQWHLTVWDDEMRQLFTAIPWTKELYEADENHVRVDAGRIRCRALLE